MKRATYELKVFTATATATAGFWLVVASVFCLIH